MTHTPGALYRSGMPRQPTPHTGSIRVSPAEVVTLTTRYWKARVTLEPNRVLVQTQRRDTVDDILEVTVQQIGDDTWEALDVDGRRVATIRQQKGCACGGTRVEARTDCVGCR